ncbi:MAG: hypothetical protein ONB48_09330 [candidate division KSB1 bacterium]|nr:hypothetical protein [candidate division KSB1 bacterium]MDZ7285845.1 hypothetical protein [candidate division KSB1 bacterium]MDZ7298877.1 hypothetical protein [candidate division KSB1 bacterium]MDZ7349978.1 hypothetical protein [candidate division KSB1 bacterium]MDZ7353769.1 hypothetical protein [candidate division KSB1 bacterium]
MNASPVVLYREHQPMKRWIMRLLMLAVAFASAFLLALMLLGPHLPGWVIALLLLPVLGLAVATFTFRRLSIEVTETGIAFGFGFVRTRLRWQEIESVAPQPYLFTRFVGWGVRYDLRDTFAFVAQSGMGIELKTRKRWRYFITTDRPQELVDLVRARLTPCAAQVHW